MRYAFVIDQSRCIGCHACSLACKAEHDVPLGSYRTWVKYVEKGAFPDVRRFFSVLRCNHCELAPCVEICPVTALYRRDDGIVDFDRDVCIGCKGCMQACPYDALYIHPERGTAEKCNFCAHRIEIDLEPPCATVCPAEAILVGDLDDASSRVSRIVATQQVSVRKPEKGTLPKVFYVEGEPRALTPGAASPTAGYLWADSGEPPPVWGSGNGGAATTATDEWRSTAASPTANGGGTTAPADWISGDLPPAAASQAAAAAAQAATAEQQARDRDFFSGAWAGLAAARVTYDVAHERPWGWKVSGYLWTKSIAAGAFLVAALAEPLGVANSNAVAVGAPLLGLLFLALTTVLLVADLKRPERFWTILTRPNWDSWLARGAFVLTAFGLLGTAWAALEIAAWRGAPQPTLIAWLRWPVVAAAVASAGYSGYLFAQAKGRDYWQNPLLPAHLVVQAVIAGIAGVSLVAGLAGASALGEGRLYGALAAALLLHVLLVFGGEVTVAHASRDGHIAGRALLRGSLRGWFWSSMLLAVTAMAMAAVGFSGLPIVGAIALLAVALYEHAWLLAGQAPPLS